MTIIGGPRLFLREQAAVVEAVAVLHGNLLKKPQRHSSIAIMKTAKAKERRNSVVFMYYSPGAPSGSQRGPAQREQRERNADETKHGGPFRKA